MKKTAKSLLAVIIVLSLVFSFALPYCFADSNVSDVVLDIAKAISPVDGLKYGYGSSGEGVRANQKMLCSLGYLGSADGVFGDNTYGAICKFQRDVDLNVTGVLDNPTQIALVLSSEDTEIRETNEKTVVLVCDNYAAIKWKDGKCYVGLIDSNNNLIEGTYVYENGDYYAGRFSNNERNGQGTAHFTNGDVYSGNWSNDKMNGYGTYYFGGMDSMEKYEGNWKENKMSGNGTYTLSNGSKVTGTWENNAHKSW